jgi:hypothetical protein
MNMIQKISIASAIGALVAGSASASIIASENFGYAAGYISGQNGGTGWGGAWTSSSSAFVDDPTVSFSATTEYSGYGNGGGHLRFRSDYRNSTRALNTAASGAFDTAGYLDGSSNINGADGTELWISVYYQRTANEANGGVGALILQRDGSSIVTAKQNYTDSDPHLYVINILFSDAGNDTITTYYDPNLGGAPAGGIVSSVADASFDAIQLAGQFAAGSTPFATIAFDSVKIGTSAADIGFTAIPEPGTYALLFGLFAFSSIALRRRK